MKSYYYNDIYIGQTERFTAEITAEDMDMFRKITGDFNPLHSDDEIARSRGYDGRLVFGMLTASYLSTLAGMYLPGERSVIYEVETKFIKPIVFTSSVKITVTGTVTEKADVFKRIVIASVISTSEEQKVLRATMKVGIAE